MEETYNSMDVPVPPQYSAQSASDVSWPKAYHPMLYALCSMLFWSIGDASPYAACWYRSGKWCMILAFMDPASC